MADLQRASAGRVALSLGDITDQDSVNCWARPVAVQVDSELDLLISSAEVLTPGPVEVLPLDPIQREFEVNVLGAMAVIYAFLPKLRRARGRIVQTSTWTASLPLPFNGASGASQATMDVFATVYPAELKSFGVDVVVVVPGIIKTGGPARTAAALSRVSDQMSSEQRKLYGRSFDTFATALNSMQSNDCDSAAADRVIELAEGIPASSRASVGPDAEEMLRIVRERSDGEQDAVRLQLVCMS